MSKYINTDLYVEMQLYDEQYEEWDIWNGTIEDLLNQWTEQGCRPTIEIVRCKECKFRDNSQRVTNFDGKEIYCECIKGYMLEDDFCSYGERSEQSSMVGEYFSDRERKEYEELKKRFHNYDDV